MAEKISLPATIPVSTARADRIATGNSALITVFRDFTKSDTSLSKDTREGMLQTERTAEQRLLSSTSGERDEDKVEEVSRSLQNFADDIDGVLDVHRDTLNTLLTRNEWPVLLKNFLTSYIGVLPPNQGQDDTDGVERTSSVNKRRLFVSIILCYGLIRQKARDACATVVGETCADAIVIIVEALLPFVLSFLFRHVGTFLDWIPSNWPLLLTFVGMVAVGGGLYLTSCRVADKT
jgi:hypothetical protein